MRSVSWLALVILILVSPLQVDAQQITGTVRDQATGSPVANAQVFIEALGTGVLTQASGQYLLLGVPAGTHTVTVTSLGYRTETNDVTVSEGGTGVLDFIVSAEALQLDEILVTGTATGSRAREIGNAIGRLDASVAEVQPIINLSDLLRGRMPGVVIQQGSGDVGTASTIKIRGSSTMRRVNDGPLIYIDGVRASNRMESGGRDVSRIDDLDPAMIESLEVIKGPAAATLYGTEAANGVINITTKKGAVGEAQWNFTMRQGSQWFRDPAGRTPTNWGVNPNTGQIESLNILENKTERDLIFHNGHTQYYGIDVSGGSDRFRYFVAGSAAMDDGVTENSWANKYNGRINLTAQPSENITLSANAGLGLIRMRIPSDYPYEEAVYAGPADCARVPDRRCYRRGIPEARVARDFDYNNANRMTAGFTATHTPFDWLTHRLTFGTDLTNQAEDNLDAFLAGTFAEYYSASSGAGGRRINRESVSYTTFDYAATGERTLTDDLASTTSAGFQVYTKSVKDLTASGRRFPALGLTAVSATGQDVTGSDGLVENNTVGAYVQQQFGWQDRFFITGAVRADDNSSFGEDFSLVYYPKVSTSVVVNDALRVRAAYGESGQQPDAFDALRSFTTRLSPTGGATVTPLSPGNSELGPERGVEIEAGFDATLFGGRVTVDFTYYDQTTKDAIVGRYVPPSTGFTARQFVNIGEIKNRGIELGLGTRIIESAGFDWDMDINLSTNKNEVTDLGLKEGDDGYLSLGWSTRHQVGYPVGSLFAPQVGYAQFIAGTDNIDKSTMTCDASPGPGQGPIANGTGVQVACDEAAWIYQGHPDPSLEASLVNSFSIGDRLTISSLIQAKMGHTKYDLQGWWRYAAFHQTRMNLYPQEYDPRLVAEAQFGSSGEFALWVNPAGFIRWRELSATYQMPSELAQMLGSNRGSITLGARNLAMLWTEWQEWPHHDPEVVDPSNTFSGNREPQEDSAVPPLTSLVLTIRLNR